MINFLNIKMEITIGEIINVVILIVTAVIVWLYTRAAQKSNEIQERPILNLYLRKEKDTNDRYVFRLRNVGNGPAYNISFSKIVTKEWIYTPYLNEPNPILERNGDEKSIKFLVDNINGNKSEFYNGSIGFQFFVDRLFTEPMKEGKEYKKIARKAGIFLITYQAINSKTYYSLFRFYSKITPLTADCNQWVVEFICSDEGKINMKETEDICDKKDIITI